jgi:hypothetical protein
MDPGMTGYVEVPGLAEAEEVNYRKLLTALAA